MDLAEYFAAASQKVEAMTVGIDQDVFTLYLKCLDRTQLDQLWRQASRRVFDSQTRAYRDEPNPDKLRKLLVDQVIVDWKGLTFGIAARLAKRVPPNGAAPPGTPSADDLVPFNPVNALLLCEKIVNLENEMWRQLMQSVERREAEEAAEKKV